MPWVKGQSGNPAGRKPVPDDVKKALLEAVPKALDTIIDLAMNAKMETVKL